MKIVALAGGVGGAKLADGLSKLLQPSELTIVVNTGDDFSHLGLRISPDLDTVCYTLAGLANPITGWGRADESWAVLEGLEKLGGPTWFRIGDKDFSTHLERTRRLSAGEILSQITKEFCRAWGVLHPVIPMTDGVVETWVDTIELGWLPFQEYFVRHTCEPKVKSFTFHGIDTARPAPGVLEAIYAADCVIVCPSNPWVSIDPILHLDGVIDAMRNCPVRVAVSPIIGGKAIKGPAAKMYEELGVIPSALAVANHYKGWLNGFIFDEIDNQYLSDINATGIKGATRNTMMVSSQDRIELAKAVIGFCLSMKQQERLT
jgi:LPPG:FO 2-phospho-L-lactate transferase